MEQAVHDAWEDGRLRYKLEPEQRKAYDILKIASPEEVFFLLCHRGFGKTFIGCTVASETTRTHQVENILILSSTLKKLRTIVKPAFETIMTDCPDEYRLKYNTQDSYYESPTGVRAHLLAAEKGHIENARGIHKVVLVLIDEAAFFGDEDDSYPLDYVIEHILNPMFIRTKSKPRIIIMTTPPDVPNHPCKVYYDIAVQKGSAAIFDIYHSDIPPEKIQEQRRRCKDPLAWQREYECKWVVDPSRVIIPEWSSQCVQEFTTDDYFQFYHKYEALDMGAGELDWTCDILCHYDFLQAKLFVHDEIVLKGVEVRTDVLASQVRSKESTYFVRKGQPLKVHRRIGDNENKIMLQDLTYTHKLPHVPAQKSELHAMVNVLRQWVNSGRVIIHPRCKYLIGCLENGTWDKAREDFTHSTAYGHFDGIPPLMYLIPMIDQNTNPVPAEFGLSIHTHNMMPTKPESANYKTLREALHIEKPKLTTEDWRPTGVRR